MASSGAPAAEFTAGGKYDPRNVSGMTPEETGCLPYAIDGVGEDPLATVAGRLKLPAEDRKPVFVVTRPLVYTRQGRL